MELDMEKLPPFEVSVGRDRKTLFLTLHSDRKRFGPNFKGLSMMSIHEMRVFSKLISDVADCLEKGKDHISMLKASGGCEFVPVKIN